MNCLNNFHLRFFQSTCSIVDKCVYLISLAIHHGKTRWIVEQKVSDVLTQLSDDFDIPALKWIKAKLGLADNNDDGKKQSDMSERKRRAMAMREKMMEKMRLAQKKAIESNPEYYKSPEKSENDGKEAESSDSEESLEFTIASNYELHVTDDERINRIDDQWTCILCQEDRQVSCSDENPLVMMGFLERSTVLNRLHQSDFKAVFAILGLYPLNFRIT